MRTGRQERRQRRACRLDAGPVGKIEIDDEKAISRVLRVTARRQQLARTPDRENPPQRLAALFAITEEKNDDSASGEASISKPSGLMNRKADHPDTDISLTKR